MLALRPDLRIADLRGNVPTRLRKACEGRYDAILLARAGLVRLGLDPAPLRLHLFTPADFVPAPAQGALAVQIRAGEARRPQDAAVAAAVARLHDAPTARAVAAERLLLAACEGGCNLPLGAWAVLAGDEIILTATLGQPDGSVRRCAVRAADPATRGAPGAPRTDRLTFRSRRPSGPWSGRRRAVAHPPRRKRDEPSPRA